MFEIASAKAGWGGSQADGNTKQVIARAPSRFRRSEYTHLKGNFKLYLMLMVPSLQDLKNYEFSMFEVASANAGLGGSHAHGNTKQVIARAPSRFRRWEYHHSNGNFKLYLTLTVSSLQDLKKYEFWSVFIVEKIWKIKKSSPKLIFFWFPLIWGRRFHFLGSQRLRKGFLFFGRGAKFAPPKVS